MRLIAPFLIALLLLPTACGKKNRILSVASSNIEVTQAAYERPLMRWDHRTEAADWTKTAMTAIVSGHGAGLTAIVPADYQNWCPAYAQNNTQDRAAFWVGLLSAMAKHESTWNPAAVGGGGKWYGLVQILPATARGYGCNAQSGAALKNGSANLSCAVRIMAFTVKRDGVISKNMRGVAADWGPFHSARKRADMREWVSEQSYCQ